MGDLCLLPHVLIFSFFYLYATESWYIFHIWGFNPIIFAQIDPVWVLGSLISGSCDVLTYCHLCVCMYLCVHGCLFMCFAHYLAFWYWIILYVIYMVYGQPFLQWIKTTNKYFNSLISLLKPYVFPFIGNWLKTKNWMLAIFVISIRPS